MSRRRVFRKDFVIPPCTEACPAGVDVPRYIRAVRDGRYDEAVAVLREKLPLPVVCADACFAPCEEVCAYRQFGDSIAIRAIKRGAVDNGGEAWKARKAPIKESGKKVAIVGAGPAGLTAAYYLRSKGHQVTLLDAFPEPGGMLRYGIPEYRLPKSRLDKDVQEILNLGVVFKGGVRLGKDINLADLKKEYNAVFLATGANASIRIPLEGSEKEGVFWGWDFLKDVAMGNAPRFEGDVVVVGGGNVAIDVALTAKRLGASTVHLFCLERREEMPAHPWEIDRAEEEGIIIHNSWGPKGISGENKVTAVTFMRCLSVFDAQGAFNPAYDPDINYKQEASAVILAVGQKVDLSYLEGSSVNKNGARIRVSSENLATTEPGIFAGGDAVSGPTSIIQAIAHGRKAASAIDKYLGGDGQIEEVLAEPEEEVFLDVLPPTPQPRQNMPLLKPWKRIKGFKQIELGFSEEQLKQESSRCLQCDARKFIVTLNAENCKECGYCAEVCSLGTFVPADFFNAKGYRPRIVKTSDHCVGCFKCYFVCPDFAIDVVEATP